MSKSIKLKNNIYLDSKSITHNRETLFDYLTIKSIPKSQITKNSNYVGNYGYLWVKKIGKLVIANIDFQIIALPPTNTVLLSGFPTLNVADWGKGVFVNSNHHVERAYITGNDLKTDGAFTETGWYGSQIVYFTED